eukprot:1833111-Rhodomonas_salina.3
MSRRRSRSRSRSRSRRKEDEKGFCFCANDTRAERTLAGRRESRCDSLPCVFQSAEHQTLCQDLAQHTAREGVAHLVLPDHSGEVALLAVLHDDEDR